MKIKYSKYTEEDFGIGAEDLLQALSDFLLRVSAYAELHFTERMWPEFDAEDLAEALGSFHRRERRFGGLQALPLEPAPSL